MNLMHGIVIILSAVIFLFYKLSKQRNSALQNIQALRPPNPETPQPPSFSPLLEYENGAVCSDSDVCSRIGRDIMEKSAGSAVDAAIATLFCNGLLAMQSMGLGGGVIMNIYSSSEQRAYSILSRERAPLQFQLPEGNISTIFQSALGIAVPAEIAGYSLAYQHFGKLPWRQLVEPTTKLCRQGYYLTKHQRDSVYINGKLLKENAVLRKMFIDPKTGQVFRTGAHVRPPEVLCRTYEALARDGPADFYHGDLMERVLKDLREFGSPIDELDMRNMTAELAFSPNVTLGPYTLHVTPPPGSGYIVAFVMSILQKFSKKFATANDIDANGLHRIVEALKFGFVERWKLDVEVTEEELSNLTNATYTRHLAYLIDEVRTFKDATSYGASEHLVSRTDHGTAHISVLAPNGDAVAATSSINFYFGSGKIGTRSGILFNNALSDFAIDGLQNYFDLPNMPYKNRVKPGASPMSSMSPIIVTDRNGEVRLVTGAAGGTKIISVLVHILVRILYLEQNIKEAIDAPRFHHQLEPNILEYEFGILQEVVNALETKGHKTKRYRERGSAVCGIERVRGKVYGNADYRKEGDVMGF
ncbi:glutathione hydrolase 1 proenzyme [Anastrepha obliqua]|uniref:glutathione hydrolase 1 proenzyme n=1 Tax=Anastrepha obliqua TaxID=95512 RepID=UPI00240A4E1F|nr:glutathione hydrolase 1 proenzyme [Anastrepha obliqua]XP_054729828.1 glutathione hydrolase 1 proenzyme [Anastrepha obliqua]